MKKTAYTVVVLHVLLLFFLCTVPMHSEKKDLPPPPILPTMQLHMLKSTAPQDPLTNAKNTQRPTSQPPLTHSQTTHSPSPKKKTSSPEKRKPLKQPTPSKKGTIPPKTATKTPLKKTLVQPTPVQAPKGAQEKLRALQKKIELCSLSTTEDPVTNRNDAMGDEAAISDKYTEQLVTLLEQNLSLPTFGEVELLLTLQKNGTCTKVEVIRSESPLNADLLQKQLQSTQFPPLIQEPVNGDTYTFKLVFYNRSS